MKTLVWMIRDRRCLTWLCTAVSSRFGTFSHLVPDAAVIVLTFLAMHREPAQLALVASALGYLIGRQMLAPFGLMETAMVACAVITYLTAGHLSGSGSMFLGIASGGAVMFFHLASYLLLVAVRGSAGFTGWVTALLLPNAVITALLALVLYPGLIRLERVLNPEKTGGLSWR